jgi:hypothetical protein
MQENKAAGNAAAFRAQQVARRYVSLPPGEAVTPPTKPKGAGAHPVQQRAELPSSGTSMPIDLAESPDGSPLQQPSTLQSPDACADDKSLNKSRIERGVSLKGVHISPKKRQVSERDQSYVLCSHGPPVHTQRCDEVVEID